MPLLLRLLRRFGRVVLLLAIRWVVRAVRVARGRSAAGGSSGTPRPGAAVIDVEPRGMFDRFNDPARRAVAASVELARREGSHRAEVGHLLLALATGDTVAAAMLREHGVDPDDLRTALARGASGPPSRGHDGTAGADPPVSPAVARVLDRAPRSARRAGRYDVTPRDLLQAIAEVDDPDLRALLRRTGVPEDTLRRAFGL